MPPADRQQGLRGGAAGAAPTSQPLPQINAELFALTYGSLVRQLISDFEDLELVNKQLDTMGYNIGIRLVDEFLARSRMSRCGAFRDTAETVAKQAFPMFLNMAASVGRWSEDGKECSLAFGENPLTEFVDLPSELSELKYCSLLCGVIRGALEMVNIDVEVSVEKDMLRGDDSNELRMRLKEHKDEKFPYTEDD